MSRGIGYDDLLSVVENDADLLRGLYQELGISLPPTGLIPVAQQPAPTEVRDKIVITESAPGPPKVLAAERNAVSLSKTHDQPASSVTTKKPPSSVAVDVPSFGSVKLPSSKGSSGQKTSATSTKDALPDCGPKPQEDRKAYIRRMMEERMKRQGTGAISVTTAQQAAPQSTDPTPIDTKSAAFQTTAAPTSALPAERLKESAASDSETEKKKKARTEELRRRMEELARRKKAEPAADAERDQELTQNTNKPVATLETADVPKPAAQLLHVNQQPDYRKDPSSALQDLPSTTRSIMPDISSPFNTSLSRIPGLFLSHMDNSSASFQIVDVPTTAHAEQPPLPAPVAPNSHSDVGPITDTSAPTTSPIMPPASQDAQPETSVPTAPILLEAQRNDANGPSTAMGSAVLGPERSLKRSRKRPVASDFDDYPASSGSSTPFKRQFGQNHVHDEEQMIIDVSEDEESNEEREQACEKMHGIQSLDIRRGFRDRPALSDFPSRSTSQLPGLLSSAPLTPSSQAELDNLRRKEEEIQAMNRKIAEMEERRKRAKIETNKRPVPESSRQSSVAAVVPTAAASKESPASVPPSASADLRKAPGLISSASETDERKRRRRAEIEASISASDIALANDRLRVEQLQREMQAIQDNMDMTRRAREVLANEMEGLGFDTEGISHADLQAMKDEFVHRATDGETQQACQEVPTQQEAEQSKLSPQPDGHEQLATSTGKNAKPSVDIDDIKSSSSSDSPALTIAASRDVSNPPSTVREIAHDVEASIRPLSNASSRNRNADMDDFYTPEPGKSGPFPDKDMEQCSSQGSTMSTSFSEDEEEGDKAPDIGSPQAPRGASWVEDGLPRTSAVGKTDSSSDSGIDEVSKTHASRTPSEDQMDLDDSTSPSVANETDETPMHNVVADSDHPNGIVTDVIASRSEAIPKLSSPAPEVGPSKS